MRVERLEHVQAAKVLDEIGVEEREGWQDVRVQQRIVEEISERRRHVAFQRREALPDLQRGVLQRIVQMQHAPLSGRTALGGRLRGEFEECGDRKGNPDRVILLPRLARRRRFADGDQGDAEPVGVVMVLQALRAVVADELEAAQVVRIPPPVDLHAELDGDAEQVDRVHRAGTQFVGVVYDSQQAGQRLIVNVAIPPELGVITVQFALQAGIEQVAVRGDQGGGEHSQRAITLALNSRGLTLQKCQFGQHVCRFEGRFGLRRSISACSVSSADRR